MICHCGMRLDLVQGPGYVETLCPLCGKDIMRYMTSAVLERNPDIVYVYDEALFGPGSGWAREHKNTYGFITKREENVPYDIEEYGNIFFAEVYKLVNYIKNNQKKTTFFIKKLGDGSDIIEKIIASELKKMLRNFESVYYFF